MSPDFQKTPRRKLRALLFFGLLLSLGTLLWFLTYEEESSFTQVTIEEQVYELEVARTPLEKERGLGGRAALCSTCALLFLFEDGEKPRFWMKDMRFPLDIAWLQDERIVYIERRISPTRKEIFASPLPANRVLELNAGALDKVTVGEYVHFHRKTH